MRLPVLVSVSGFVVLAACANDDAGQRAVQGQLLYQERFEDGNQYACATCHTLAGEAADGFRRAGHPIGGANARASYKNGKLTDLRDAVNACLTDWMAAAPLSENDARWTALRNFLAGAGTNNEEVSYTIAEPPSSLEGGDEARGEQLFNQSCAICHGAGAAGTNLAPGLIGRELTREETAARVRLSGPIDSEIYPGLESPSRMPFWSTERLSDDELRDLSEFVFSIGDDDVSTPDAGMMMNDAGMMQECGDDHPMVGKTAVINGKGYDVAGTVSIVDNCTLVVEDFSYDGGGIDVRWFAGTDLNFDPPTGFAMSEDLLGMEFRGATYTIHIPPGRSLDDFDSVSVWCVAAGQDFGSAQFE